MVVQISLSSAFNMCLFFVLVVCQRLSSVVAEKGLFPPASSLMLANAPSVLRSIGCTHEVESTHLSLDWFSQAFPASLLSAKHVRPLSGLCAQLCEMLRACWAGWFKQTNNKTQNSPRMNLWRGVSWIHLENILCGSREVKDVSPGVCGLWMLQISNWGLGLMAPGILWIRCSNSNSTLK